jgi:acetyltransferase-like isoleucine patch superfamily enzyme
MPSDRSSNTRGRTGLPDPFVRLARRILARLAIHENVKVGRSIRVGRGVVISSPHGLVIGDWVNIGPRSIIQVDGTIGDFALIGMGVQIVGRLDHAVDEIGVPYVFATWAGDRPAIARDRVEIGRDVWIGGGSVILSGVSIGEGALIGSGSVVTRDVPEFTIAAGNPARVVRNRFASKQDEVRHSLGLDDLARSMTIGDYGRERAS